MLQTNTLSNVLSDHAKGTGRNRRDGTKQHQEGTHGRLLSFFIFNKSEKLEYAVQKLKYACGAREWCENSMSKCYYVYNCVRSPLMHDIYYYHLLVWTVISSYADAEYT